MGKRPEPGGLTFNPFSELKEKEEEKKQLALQEKYQGALAGKYDKLGEIFGEEMVFVPDIPGIEKISLMQPKEGGELLYATIFFKDKQGRENHVTASIFPAEGKGILSLGSGELKRIADAAGPEADISRDAIFEEILKHVEGFKLNLWHVADITILEKSSERERALAKAEAGKMTSKEIKKEERKLDYFQKHTDIRAIFVQKELGLTNGYKAYLMGNCVVLESPIYGHATFIVPLDPPIDWKKYNKIPNDQQCKEILKMSWTKYADTTATILGNLAREDKEREERGEKRLGFFRQVHRPEDEFEKWERAMNELLEKIDKMAEAA